MDTPVSRDPSHEATVAPGDPIPERGLSTVPISGLERAAAAAVGSLVAGAGLVAVFRTENEIGTAALLLAGSLFMLISIGFVPTSLKSGAAQIEWSRAAREVLRDRLDATADDAERDLVQEDLEQQAAVVDPGIAVRSMLDRFVRFSDSEEPRALHDGLCERGWSPRLPPKSTYIRWVRPDGKISLFQNSRYLVTVSTDIRDFASTLPGAKPRAKRYEVEFEYLDNVDTALAAVDSIGQELDRRAKERKGLDR